MLWQYTIASCLIGMLFFWRCSSGDLVLKEGEKAPDFSLKSGNGTTIRLSDFRGKSNVVLYFYPKDQTPGCTKEACSFRDNFQSFKDVGAEILGVSVDDEKSHEEFQREYNLNFTLLADTDKQVNKRYGVLGPFGLSKRVTFLIDKEGVIRKIFPSVDVSVHSEEVLAALKSLTP